jgi:Protein of unknown function (DUF3305)
MSPAALARIPVGVVVERRKARSPWIEFLWRPVFVFAGEPSAEPWTALGSTEDITLFYAGAAAVELYRTETANYSGNLESDGPLLWVILRPTGSEPAYRLLSVTADPAEGEALAAAGNDLVETVPMPAMIAREVADFVGRHHVEEPFFKRRRDGAEPNRRDRGKGEP